MKQVPNIDCMSLEEAKTHFNKLPDLERRIKMNNTISQCKAIVEMSLQ